MAYRTYLYKDKVSAYFNCLFLSTVEEIVSFSQYDLAPEMVGVVDAHDAVFVWLGQHCCPRAKDDPRSIALAYLAQGNSNASLL